MAGILTANSKGLTGSSTAVTQQLTGATGSPIAATAAQLIVTNRTGVEVFMTVDGTVPTVGGANTYCLPASVGIQMVIVLPRPPDQDDAYKLPNVSLQAIGAAAWSIWLEMV